MTSSADDGLLEFPMPVIRLKIEMQEARGAEQTETSTPIADAGTAGAQLTEMRQNMNWLWPKLNFDEMDRLAPILRNGITTAEDADWITATYDRHKVGAYVWGRA